MGKWQTIDGGVTAPQGFEACGVAAGIKSPDSPEKDVALILSKSDASVAGVFTTNRVQAAPVHLDRERVAGGLARAILVNSGNANACTGEIGMRNAVRMAACAAQALGLPESQVLLCSTGVIGVNLPMDRVESGITAAAATLSEVGGADAAEAIMTTDTVPKSTAREINFGDQRVVIGGMSKGSGMIEPNMATMLAFLTTDAEVAADDLSALLKSVANASFNRITVDGDQSTNDALLMLANGASGVSLAPGDARWDTFADAVRELCMELARMMVKDGEGATKVVTVNICGAADADDAEKVARAIANSSLFKTACYGEDPNWGRVIAAVGYSGAQMDESLTEIRFDDEVAYSRGTVADSEALSRLEAVMKQDDFTVTVDMGLGDAESTVLTCDFSLDYVRINSEYTT